ncbi:crossover junction endodeoxyribonuclease RuvC [Dasania marina]|uniref:crossover junction endodeoxyribonuclease RuvC n=1 Tax=Dasania marina TaxID=471499 RepID=UPI000376FC2C|nr:crossover junction endodeoxyribonuclease RuvC [Dasania marina]|tara:strand:+ start:56036 stop:56554 length:519 start_codon:yes stop_codon:yes gene_type:complete
MAIILGIDPGSRKTGFGIINVVGNQHDYITSGVIRLPDTELPERLKVIFESINELIVTYCPQQAAIEQVFMAKNAGAALKLGQARGAAIVACMTAGLEASEYSALQIKQAVVGTGAAKKEQVQHMVKMLLKLPGLPQEDAADALAAAICHAHTQASLINMAGATRMRRGRIR